MLCACVCACPRVWVPSPQTAVRRLAPLGSVYFVRQPSPAAATLFPDSFLDFVYVDARHDYVSVLTDLMAFWPKLAPGGILAGHDFLVSPPRHCVCVSVSVFADGLVCVFRWCCVSMRECSCE